MKTVAIIKIAGKGTRIHSSVPKQYIEVNGNPVFVHTLIRFNNCKAIDDICLVCDEEHMEYVKSKCKEMNLNKVVFFSVGGKNGNASTFNGFVSFKDSLDDDDIIVSHDGVRSLVTNDLINDSVDVAKKYGAAIASYKTSGNILFKDDNCRFIHRDQIFVAQTPISLKKSIMTRCYDFFINQSEEAQDAYAGLDDIVFSLGIPMFKSKGDSLNFKITTDNDLVMFKALMEKNNDSKQS